MDFHEKFLLVLYAAIAVFVAIEFYDLWNLAIVFFGILVISIVQKMSSNRKMKIMEDNRGAVVGMISQKIDAFSSNINSLKADFSRSIEFLDNKINVVNSIYESEMKKDYSDVSSRISSFEEKLERIREALDVIYSNIDSRIASLENRDKQGV
jgi:peptidoglycan hydrolase CwlO-like protein